MQVTDTSPSPGEALVEHGLDFVAEAVRRLVESEGDVREARYAIMHLAMGAELLLKSRLFREHWTLVFDKPESANRAKLESGDFKSVGPEQCVERLENVCGIRLGERTKRALDDLRRARNKVVHFAVHLPETALRSQAAKVLAGLVDFIDAHCEILEISPEAKVRAEILSTLRELNIFLDERREEIRARVEALGDDVFSCPVCHEVALVIDGEPHCLFCLERVLPKEAAEWHAENSLGYSAHEAAKEGWWPFATCPECGAETLLRVGEDTDARKCFQCGVRYDAEEIATCVECGEAFRVVTEDDDQICPDCFQGKLDAAD